MQVFITLFDHTSVLHAEIYGYIFCVIYSERTLASHAET